MCRRSAGALEYSRPVYGHIRMQCLILSSALLHGQSAERNLQHLQGGKRVRVSCIIASNYEEVSWWNAKVQP